MIKFEVISLKKQYELPRYNDYYSIENNTVQNGYINVSKELSKSTFFKKIGTVKDFRISLDIQMCSKLGISLKNKKFYLMNLFVGHSEYIAPKYRNSRQSVYHSVRSYTNIDYCMIDTYKPRYELYDKIIIYMLFKKYNILNFNYISNNSILIIEDSKDILLNTIKHYILNTIKLFNINNVILLHGNTKILNSFNKITQLKFVTYYPYPVSIQYNEQKLIQHKKEYDILLFGKMRTEILLDNVKTEVYPFRIRLNLLLIKYKNTILKDIKLKILTKTDEFVGDDLIKKLKQSKYVICTSSRFDLLLRKYIEVNYSNTYIIGNNPYNIVPSDSIIIIEPHMSDNTILSILKNAVNNYNNLKRNVTPIMGGNLTNQQFFDDIMDMSFVQKYNNYITDINKFGWCNIE
tara:strand:- start:1242 stop:2456 length:1215 start_codon:yes stop_codon:yes gene_type:complete